MNKVFITGGSGFIGNAIAHAFKRNGDQVVCLCRTDKSQQQLTKQGFTAIVGDMNHPESFKTQASNADVIIDHIMMLCEKSFQYLDDNKKKESLFFERAVQTVKIFC